MNRQVLLLCMLLSVSCAKQTIDTTSGNQTISASGSDARTSLSGKSVLWNAGDAMSVFDGVSNCRFETSGSGTSASFIGSAVDKDHYYVTYPYNQYASYNEGTITTSFPESQTAIAGTFAPEANVSAAITTKIGGRHKATMYNAGCYFKFIVEKSESAIIGVEASAIGGENLAGDVIISFDSEGVPSVASGKNSRAANLSDSGNIFTPGTYWLVVAPGALSQGLRISVNTASGTMVYDFAGMKALERNQIYNIGQSLDYPLLGITHEGIMDDQVLCSASHEGIAETTNISEWSTWTDAESAKTLFAKAATDNKAYFTDYKYYNYESYNYLRGKCDQYGYPLMFSVDLFKASSSYFPTEQTTKIRANLISVVKKAWAKSRCIPALSWHLENPYADYEELQGAAPARYFYGSSDYPNYPVEYRYVVRHILNNTNGKGDWFDARCQDVAGIINSFVDGAGNPIPVVFRLFHECEHNWAWWQLNYFNSNANCSIDEYKALFQLAVTKIKQYCPNAEILFCYNMDRGFSTEYGYMRAYPGDDYVDILSYDDYAIGNKSKGDTKDELLTRARVVSSCAASHGKIAALFETNNNSDDEEDQETFYSDYIQSLITDPQSKLSFVGTWAVNLTGDIRKNAFAEFIESDYIIFAE